MTEISRDRNIQVPKEKNSKRWLLALLILVVLNILVVRRFKPVEPEINIASESLLFHVTDGEIISDPWFSIPLIGNVYLTNTIPAIAIVFIVLLIIAFAVHRQTKDGQLKTHGIVLMLETTISALTNMIESTVEEKWRDRIYPFFITIFLYVLIANLTKLLPFFETIGFAYPTSVNGFQTEKWTSWFYAIQNTPADAGDQGYRLISMFRGAPTDLNFTLAIALFTVVLIQVFGVEAHGIGYFNKFVNIRAMVKNPKTGIVQVFVGLLELIGEIAKIASFGFRLFGNMFAGMVLLMFLGFVIPYVVSSGIMLYEIFVGILQAFIFGILTTVFMGMAVAPSEH